MQSYSSYVPSAMCFLSSDSPDSSGSSFCAISGGPVSFSLDCALNYSLSTSPSANFATLHQARRPITASSASSVKDDNTNNSTNTSHQCQSAETAQHRHQQQQHQSLYKQDSSSPPYQSHSTMLQEAYSNEFTRLSTADKCNKTVSVQLLDLEIWKRFCEVNNEMIVTKSGRYVKQHFCSNFILQTI